MGSRGLEGAQALVAQDKGAADGRRFDPVTEADRGAERAIRALLAERRPRDGVFGEGEARTDGSSGLTWIVDPVDGTRSFISGLPLWGVLIALDDGARGRIGVIDQPYLRERFVGVLREARAEAWMEGPAGRLASAFRSGTPLFLPVMGDRRRIARTAGSYYNASIPHHGPSIWR